MKINLKNKDRCLSFDIKTTLGTYHVNLEFLGHAFGPSCDDVQVSVLKKGKTVNGCDSAYKANRVSISGKVERPDDEGTEVGILPEFASVWYEFHKVGNLPPVVADDAPSDWRKEVAIKRGTLVWIAEKDTVAWVIGKSKDKYVCAAHRGEYAEFGLRDLERVTWPVALGYSLLDIAEIHGFEFDQTA